MIFLSRKLSLISNVLIAIAAGLWHPVVLAETTDLAADETIPVISWQQPVISWQQSEPTGRLIVKYLSAHKPWQSPRGSKKFTRDALRSTHQLALERNLSDVKELVLAEGFARHTELTINSLRLQADALSAQSQVEYASIEYRRYPLAEPNDPLYQGALPPGNQSYLFTGEFGVHAPGAWDITTGSSSSVIAIVDTGVLPNHPEIKNRSVAGLGYDFVSADSPNDYTSANDGGGRDPNPIDPGDACNGGSSSWHGTGVASAAAGNSNDGEGMAGIDWNAQLLHVRALGVCGGTDADIIDAIRWSAGLPVTGVEDNPTPANVVNLSLGGLTECTKAWQDVIDELAELNVVFVMAAGNESRNALRSSPGNCANVITVGSSTSDGDVDARFSNYGMKVTTATAGRDIVVASNSGLSTMDPTGDFYRTEIGTSFSAALVSGAISLMHSLNPDLGPSGVRALLHESATPYAKGSDCDLYHCGAGILDLARALTFLQEGNYDPDRNTAAELIANQSSSVALQTETSATLFGYKDIRYFSVEVTERGLLQAQTTGTTDLYGYLLNADLSVLALDDDSGTGFNFRVASLVDPGTYYIAVERESHRRSDAEVQFTLNTSVSGDAPSPFTFPAKPDVAANAIVSSNSVTITGLQNESVVTVSDGFYSLNNRDPVNTPSTVRNGDTLQVVLQSPGSPMGVSTATVTVGAYTTSFSVTTSEDGIGPVNNHSSRGRTSKGCTVSEAAAFDPLFLLLLTATCAALVRRRKFPGNS